MATRITDYQPKATEPSRLELVSMAKWIDENKLEAYLVGGWAVYYHTKGGARPPAKYEEPGFYERARIEDSLGFQTLGSKDIDLVFLNKAGREEFEQEYCRKNDFVKRGLSVPKEWVKHILGVDVVFDPDLVTNSWKVGGITVGWAELPKNSQHIEIEDGVKIRVQKKELLLLYKSVALVERSIRRKQPNPEAVRLDSKIWKDSFDILALHDTGINEQTLSKLAKQTGFAPILEEAKRTIKADYAEYGFIQYTFSNQFLGN